MVKKKIVGYCRISTLEQKKKGFGLDIQIREIKKFAKDNGLVIDCIFKDEAVPGVVEERQELDILRNICKKGEVSAIIFPSTDRTARSVRLSENLYYELNKQNVRVYFADLPFYDPDDHRDVMIRQIMEVVAESNRNAIIDRLKKGREERARKGMPAGGTVPYGYRRKGKEWLPLNAEREVVKQIFELSMSGKNPLTIAEYLNQQALKRRNGKEWTARQVAEILAREELYRGGVIRYGSARGVNKKLVIIGNE